MSLLITPRIIVACVLRVVLFKCRDNDKHDAHPHRCGRATPPPKLPNGTGRVLPRKFIWKSKGMALSLPPLTKISVAFLAECLSNYAVFGLEITMPKLNLSGMTVEALMHLRSRVDEMLLERRAEIETQLEQMDRAIVVVGRRRVAGRSALKGRKVPPKYRSRSGETWAGRGARPRWLVAAIKGGKKIDDFLIDKSVRRRRKKRRSKR
jgi:DNA-binding protein H-NS